MSQGRYTRLGRLGVCQSLAKVSYGSYGCGKVKQVGFLASVDRLEEVHFNLGDMISSSTTNCDWAHGFAGVKMKSA